MNIPTLSSYAPAPQLAQSYATGVGLQQKDNELNANIQMEKDKLAQQAQQASLEASLKQQQIQMDAMKAAQELEVNKSYQAQSLALKHDELDSRQQEIDMKTQQAAREMQAQQMYSDEVSKAIASGKPPGEAATAGVAKYGIAMGEHAGSALAEAVRAQLHSGGGGPPVASHLMTPEGEDTGLMTIPNGQGGTYAPFKSPTQNKPPTLSPLSEGQKVLQEPDGKLKIIKDNEYFRMKSDIDLLNKEMSNPMSKAAIGKGVAAQLLTTPVPESSLSRFNQQALADYREKMDKLKVLTTAFDNYNAKQREAAARYFQGGPQVPPSVMNTNTPAPIKRGKYTVISE